MKQVRCPVCKKKSWVFGFGRAWCTGNRRWWKRWITEHEEIEMVANHAEKEESA